MNDYQKQANDFLEKTGTTFKAEFVGNDTYFDSDEISSKKLYKTTMDELQEIQ